jgi:hypothetical protein
MIKHILDILKLDDFYGKSEFIDIAKGRNEIPTTIKAAYKQGKRKLKEKDYK